MTSPRAADQPAPPHALSSAQAQDALTPPNGPPARGTRLSRRAALALAGGALGVLGIGWLADVLAVVPLSAPPTGPLTRQVGLDHVTLDLHPSPPRAGSPAQATLTVRGADGSPLAGLAVQVAGVMVEMDMRLPTQQAAEQPAGARYTCALTFLMPGTWRVDVRFGPPGGSPLTASFDVTVR